MKSGKKNETIHSGMDKLLQAGRYGKSVKRDGRMDEETNPNGILEVLEKSENEVSKP